MIHEYQLLQTLMDNIPDAIYFKDKKNRFVIVNKAIAESVNVLSKDMIGKTDFDFFPEENAKKYFAGDNRVMESGKLFIDEVEQRLDLDETVSWGSTTKIPWYEKGKIIGTIGITRNITKHRAVVEEKLQERENLLESLINNIPDSIYFKDKKNRFIRVNKAKAEHSGTIPEEMIGKTDFDFFPKERAEKSFADDNWVMKSNKLLINRVEKVTLPHGKEHWVSTTKIPWHDEKGKVIGTMGISRDITEVKKLMENLKKTKLVLELKKAEEQLRRSEKLAGLGQLAAGVVHEIRNPLGIIATSMYYLNEILPEKRKEVKKHFHIVESEIDRCQAIIHNLLEFSQTSGIEVEAVDVNALLNMTLSLVEKELFGHDIRLIKKMETVPKIKANLDEMKQVFLNLILNATQAMSRGGELRIITSTHNDKIRIKISDTGMGISKENLDRIFNPFFTTKEPGEGTGLGLALVHTIIERYGGTIHVESEEEKGTTFTVELPIFKE